MTTPPARSVRSDPFGVVIPPYADPTGDPTVDAVMRARLMYQDLPTVASLWADNGGTIPEGHTGDCVLLIRHTALWRRPVHCVTHDTDTPETP